MKEDLTPALKRLVRLIAILKGLVSEKYYGKTTISWEAGNVVNLKIEKSIKIEE